MLKFEIIDGRGAASGFVVAGRTNQQARSGWNLNFILDLHTFLPTLFAVVALKYISTVIFLYGLLYRLGETPWGISDITKDRKE